MSRLLILTSDQGGGHRAAADALVEAVGRVAAAPVEVDVVDFIDLAGPVSSARTAWAYRTLVDRATPLHTAIWTLADRAPAVTSSLVRALMPRARARLRTMVRRRRPAAVVSVYLAANHEAQRALSSLPARPPLVTVVTDIGRPPALWFSPGLDLYIVPCDGAKDCALRAGVPADRVRVLGLPIAAAFCGRARDSAAARAVLGLPEAGRIVLLVGGGEGMGQIERLASAIDGSGLDVAQVVVTGRNAALRRRLEDTAWRTRPSIHGFVTNMPDLMAAADVIVTKAGPHTVMEAMTVGRPVVLSGFVPKQEEGVVQLVLEAGAGVLADSPGKAVEALRSLLEPGADRLASMTAATRRLARPSAAEDIARVVLGLAQAWHGPVRSPA